MLKNKSVNGYRLPIEYCFHVPYCNCFIISNLENIQKSKGSRPKIVKNRVLYG